MKDLHHAKSTSGQLNSFHLLRLPNELILDIASHLSVNPLWRLRSSCSLLCSLLTPLLRPHANDIALCSARRNLREPLLLAITLGAVLPPTLVDPDFLLADYEVHEPLIREAVYEGLHHVTPILLDAGADVESPGDVATYGIGFFMAYQAEVPGTTLLHLAVLRRQVEIAVDLVARGAKVDVVSGGGKSPLFVAVEKSCVPLVELLVGAGADVNFVSPNTGESVLLVAVQKGCAKVVRMLLETGKTDWSIVPRPPLTGVVHAAARRGDPAIVALLVQHGADLNTMDRESRTPLHECVRYGRFEAIKVLVQGGAVVDRSVSKCMTPLMLAVARGDVEMVRVLVAHEQDLDWVKRWEWGPVKRRGSRIFDLQIRAVLEEAAVRTGVEEVGENRKCVRIETCCK